LPVAIPFAVRVQGAPAGVTHWQHLHGFQDGRDAQCPTQAAEANKDRIIDLIETENAAGTTMVPFIDDPVSMQVAEGEYPKADADGKYEYQSTVSLGALDTAFAKAFNGCSSTSIGASCSFTASARRSPCQPPSLPSAQFLPA
jgi:hypothetical protein